MERPCRCEDCASGPFLYGVGSLAVACGPQTSTPAPLPGGRSPSTCAFVPQDEGVVERDPSGRFARYEEEVGRGSFKRVYKAFDEHRGVDVAWNTIYCQDLHLTDEEVDRVFGEVSLGRNLSHRNVIRCYKCWVNKEEKVIHYITVRGKPGLRRRAMLLCAAAC